MSLQFEKELATFRHRLDLDAEAVRAEHQRLLHNATLVTERKHEVYRELFRLAHIANGFFGSFYGTQRASSFDGYNVADLRKYLDTLQVPSEPRERILGAWGVMAQRPAAVRQIREIERAVHLAQAESAATEAWNYFVLNQLYLNEPITAASGDVLRELRALVPIVQYPDPEAVNNPARDISRLHGETTDLLERLKVLLQNELRVAPDAGRELRG